MLVTSIWKPSLRSASGAGIALRMVSKSGARLVRVGRVERGDAGPGVGVNHFEVELVLVGGQLQEEVLGHRQHDRDARARPVDLVDHQDRLQPDLQRLAQHELGLWHRAVDGVDQQQAAVGHVQHSLDLAGEVGVARRVDDVDA